MKQNKIYTYGKHALVEALTYAPHAVLKVFIDPKVADLSVRKLIDRLGTPKGKLGEGQAKSDMMRDTAHQGVIGQISVFNLIRPYEKFAEELHVTANSSVLFLSGVVDPHNVGAIIRSAAGFGASAVLLPERGQAPITTAVLKVSAGMAFRIPLVSVSNEQQALADLKKRGFKVFGLSGEGVQTIVEEEFEHPTVFILGNEGSGIASNLKPLCDKVLKIPIHKKTESLNVAASAAVALFAWSAKHPDALK